MAFETEGDLVGELKKFAHLDLDFCGMGVFSLLSRWKKMHRSPYVEKQTKSDTLIWLICPSGTVFCCPSRCPETLVRFLELQLDLARSAVSTAYGYSAWPGSFLVT
ncbi:hypothetical protein ElyMa_001816300 [Elysia marginata]|uniref:Uncharacterized protein n=1 Tax=Elysia marginata TaxID=1093978 RepID=A0AAV4EI96_9GAST|nr:hypothetical protein ElyMa_001816300 [Elysia marginata]